MRTAGQNSWCSWEENTGIKIMKTVIGIRSNVADEDI